MNGYIAILEDNAGRLAEMKGVLAELLPQYELRVFDNAGEMIEWLRGNQQFVVLISLDHDLPVVQYRGGVAADAGTGRMVTDYLVTVPPTCPVIVHSSNDVGAAGMVMALRDGGWPVSRVYPFGEHEWVKASWGQQVRALAEQRWIVAEGGA